MCNQSCDPEFSPLTVHGRNRSNFVLGEGSSEDWPKEQEVPGSILKLLETGLGEPAGILLAGSPGLTKTRVEGS